MSRPLLFTPAQIDNLKLDNRIVIAPMAQYSAENGQMNEWHLIHLGQLASSGAGLLTIEATAVTPDGRNTRGDVGLYSDDCEAAMARVLRGVRRWSDMPIGIQLNHAGRKASRQKSWEGGAQVQPGQPDGWTTYGPSPLAFASGEMPPTALDRDGLAAIRNAFASAARRASRLGLDFIQILGAHGYLLHEFLSPLSNQRTDEYGGSLENRMRFPLEVFEAVRDVFAHDRPVTMRVSATDWVEGGWSVEDTIAFVDALQARGCAAINVSSGGSSPAQRIPIGPGYQVPLARAVKQATTLPVIAVGLITDFEHAEAILSTGDADLIALARAVLYDPRWPWHAAAHFGVQIKAPKQYLRSQPNRLRDLFV
ncbi:2,4-dienoyl-CoA reductase-like NADH-dependent reductase (Old Yellow Enzyme family) [Paraburkholderia tropica]|uniref:2,4-dienoyl-CoA reductase-like NADH-dependent reductase (Old Yellow Enzyme family) n=1 Tax=Paraburkholderia tropica TaxID=92647 RepID=A0ABX5ME45_9BURK|nr:NADH:flavin oxidoreductase/NADH oxidase [Paraburkholderia tropica]PXX07212.1 2,4-dienoyl-CoA reductase-like NADH-dependent reductase (Old Yellow Enzyme family) [Paraburkholderia tropica]PZW72749.1 2,4-dienoyl-CoA reductase-like NADH-dependent reductase (Old Yellow Enzyme family) [Paraburkholderia tropica]